MSAARLSPAASGYAGLTRHVQPGTTQWRVERHDAMRKQLQHHARGRCPVRLSITKSRRRRGSPLRSVTRVVSPACQRSHYRQFSSADSSSSDNGSAARMGNDVSCIQWYSTMLVQLRVSCTRTFLSQGRKDHQLCGPIADIFVLQWSRFCLPLPTHPGIRNV